MKNSLKKLCLFLSIPALLGAATFAFSDIIVGGGPSASAIKFLEPSGNGLNFSEIKAQAQTADITYTLPAAAGTAGTVLTNSMGDGVLSWTTPPGASSTKSYSELWYSNELDASVTIVSAGSYYPLPANTVTVGVQDPNSLAVGSATANTITIGNGGSGAYEVIGNFSWKGTSNSLVHFGVAKNGIMQPNIVGVAIQPSASAQEIHCAFSGMLNLVNGDVLDMRITSNKNADIINIYHMNLFVHRIN